MDSRRAAAAVLLAGSLLGPAAARADRPALLLHPTLVELGGRVRTAKVNVVNRGDGDGTFLIGWIDYAMTPAGGLEKLDAAPWSLVPHVRYSPRRITLAPGETQVVKISLRRTSEVPAGEYRSHLKVVTVPLVGETPWDGLESAAAVTVTARTAMAIPVVWRNAEGLPRAEIESVRLDAASRELHVSVRRLGDLTVRGYLHLLRGTDAETSVGSSVGAPVPLVIYPNLPGRTVRVPVGEAAGELPAIRGVVYSTAAERDAAELILASATLGE